MHARRVQAACVVFDRAALHEIGKNVMSVSMAVMAAKRYARWAQVQVLQTHYGMQPKYTISVETTQKTYAVRGRTVHAMLSRAVLYVNNGLNWARTDFTSDWRGSATAARFDAFTLALRHHAHVTLDAGDLAGHPVESGYRQPETGWLYGVARAAGLVR